MKVPDAERFHRLTFDEVLDRRLEVMDATAIVMCREHAMPLKVFDIFQPDNLRRVVFGEDVGTTVVPSP